MKKRLLGFGLIVCILLTMIAALPLVASAAKSGCYTYSVTNGEAEITECNSSVSGHIDIPSTLGGYPVTRIGKNAFAWCDSLTSVAIPNSVTSIGNFAFSNCDSLTRIIIPYSVTSIGNWAFENCDNLTSITIPDSVTSIGGFAFCYCDSLTRVTIPDSVTSIGKYAFVACDSLTSITIPDSVTSIGDVAFMWCDSLTSVTIPNSVTSIGVHAFDSCNNLTDVYYSGSEEEWNKINIDSGNQPLLKANIHFEKSTNAGAIEKPESDRQDVLIHKIYNSLNVARKANGY